MTELWDLFLTAAFVDNMPLTLFLGLCTFLALSRRPGSGAGPRRRHDRRAGRDRAAQPTDL